MTHCLIVDMIQFGRWELCDGLEKDIRVQRWTLGISEAHLLGDPTMRPTAPDGGARQQNQIRGFAPRETLTRARPPVRSLGYGRRMNPRRSGYLSFSSRGIGPSTYPQAINLGESRKEYR